MTPFDSSPSGFIETPAEVRDPFTLESLIAWLETKPAHEEYCWIGGHCLFAQWGEANSSLREEDAYLLATDGLSAALGLSQHPEPTAIASSLPWTFGAALKRTRATIAERSR